MTINEFFDKYANKGIDWDNAFGFQCVDVYNQYCKEVVNAPIILVVGAKDIWDNYPTEQFNRIENSIDNFPQKGDVIIWGTGLGQFGHVAICVSADKNQFTSFDQNFPLGTLCHYQLHNYNHVIGWLHPKDAIITQPIVQMPQYLKTLFQENNLINESQIREFFQKAKEFPACNQDKLNAQADLATANNTNANLKGQNSTLMDQNKVLKDRNLQLQQQLQECQNTQQPTPLVSGSFLARLRWLLFGV